MNVATAITENTTFSREPVAPLSSAPASPSVGSLLVQLDHYRRQTEWLATVNRLQARLAGANDLPGMIDAFSVWLMPQVAHDLVAFRNHDLSREHLQCSCHGPQRRRIIRAGKRLLDAPLLEENAPCQWQGEFYGCRWRLDFDQESGLLLVLRRNRHIDSAGVDILGKAANILVDPLQRALEYEKLFELARHDSLTGLANRRILDERLPALLDRAARYHHPLTLASMDLDGFKQLNDTYGHAEGDQALRRVAATLSAMVRNSDLLVRMGGDEFILLLPDSDLAAAKILAKRICQAVAALPVGNSDHGRLGISIGLSQWRPGLETEEWLQRADEALYRAKARGTSWVCLDKKR